MSKYYSIIQILFLIGFTSTLLSFGMLKENSADNNWSETTIAWDENRRLNWSDFETKKIRSSVSALTASGIEYFYNCNNGVMTVDIKAIFIPKHSWVRHDSKTTYILDHEQLHFDITELYARKFRKRFKESNIDCSNVKKLDKLANEVLAEWEKEQKNYDKESNHSINKDEQAYWDKKIKRQLELSKAYKYSVSLN